MYNVVGFSTSEGKRKSSDNLPANLYSDETITPELVKTYKAIIGVCSSKLRKKLAKIYRKKGFSFPKLIHPSSTVSKSAVLEEGIVVALMSVVSINVKLKTFTYVNFCVGVVICVYVIDFIVLVSNTLLLHAEINR